MKQRHSYTKLYYHVVMPTKNRAHLITDAEAEAFLYACFKRKAHELDSWIDTFGCWYDHIHVLIRTNPNLALSQLYGQLKGFSTWMWHGQWPDKPFALADGVFAATVDPFHCDPLRHYIQNQKHHHSINALVPNWEPDASS
ncbi:MAG: IS200/IS605 family transposase [Deltaproteobacteria bacterium]|nr:IS200/IS605 family transposase [Deltaproteobacteria bacterium]